MTEHKEDKGFEFLDHPADVIIHGWGKTKKEAFEQAVTGMFDYMTPLSGIEEKQESPEVVVENAHDMDDLLYKLMDEFLFNFCTELFVCKRVEITEMNETGLKAHGFGEVFDRKHHEQGTEIKAITMHNMHMSETPGKFDVFVTVDI